MIGLPSTLGLLFVGKVSKGVCFGRLPSSMTAEHMLQDVDHMRGCQSCSGNISHEWHASERKGETGRFLVGEVHGFGLMLGPFSGPKYEDT